MTETQGTSPKKRRTQNERSETMRLRLIEATMTCLENEGYAATTISKIVDVAEVSRGAPMHHFSSKAALIVAAAEHVINHIYLAMGQVYLNMEASSGQERLHDMVMASWREVFSGSKLHVLLEILVASKQDAELATRLQQLWHSSYQFTRIACEHYFEPLSQEFKVHKLMVLTQWLLRGMAEDRYLNSETFFEHYLETWVQLISPHIQAKPGGQPYSEEQVEQLHRIKITTKTEH